MSVPAAAAAADAAPLAASAAALPPAAAAVPVGAGVPDLGTSLLAVVVMVAALAALPWLLRRWQQRGGRWQGRGAAARCRVQVLSSAMIGPQQRVVVVDVAHDGPSPSGVSSGAPAAASSGTSSACLVLGVTPTGITCLHVLPGVVQGADAPGAVPGPCCDAVTTAATTAAALPAGFAAALQQHGPLPGDTQKSAPPQNDTPRNDTFPGGDATVAAPCACAAAHAARPPAR